MDIFSDVPATQMGKALFEDNGRPLSELPVKCGLAMSKADARRLMQGGGMYLNNLRVAREQERSPTDIIEGQAIVLRKGQKQYHLIQLTGDTE